MHELGLLQKKDLQEQLRNIIDCSKKDNKVEIIKFQLLKDAHIYCKINNLSGQITGPLIEHFIIIKNNMDKSNPSLCIGDCKKNDKNIEIKASMGGKNNTDFNYVQIRINHNVDILV